MFTNNERDSCVYQDANMAMLSPCRRTKQLRPERGTDAELTFCVACQNCPSSAVPRSSDRHRARRSSLYWYLGISLGSDGGSRWHHSPAGFPLSEMLPGERPLVSDKNNNIFPATPDPWQANPVSMPCRQSPHSAGPIPPMRRWMRKVPAGYGQRPSRVVLGTNLI